MTRSACGPRTPASDISPSPATMPQKGRFVVCPKCIADHRDAWVWASKLSQRPTCRHCGDRYPCSTSGDKGQQKANHDDELAKKLAKLEEELKQHLAFKTEVLKAVSEGDGPKLVQITKDPAEPTKQPTIGFLDRSVRDAAAKMETIEKRLIKKREELEALELEWFEAADKHVEAEKAYAAELEKQAAAKKKEAGTTAEADGAPSTETIEEAIKRLGPEEAAALRKATEGLLQAQMAIKGFITKAGVDGTAAPPTTGAAATGEAAAPAAPPVAGAAEAAAPSQPTPLTIPPASTAAAAPKEAERRRQERTAMEAKHQERKKKAAEAEKLAKEAVDNAAKQGLAAKHAAGAGGAAPVAMAVDSPTP